MNVIQKFMVKALGLDRFVRILYPYGGRATSHYTGDFDSFVDRGYGGNPYVFSVIKQITSKCAAIPWSVYRVRDEKAFRGYRVKSRSLSKRTTREFREVKSRALEEVSDTELNKILERPNERQTWHEFVEASVGFKQITGNLIILGFGPDNGENAGKFIEIIPYNPSGLEVVAGPFPAPVQGYKVRGRQEVVPPEQVLHLKYFNPANPNVGMSPLEAAILSVKANNGYAEWNYNLTENLGAIPGMITVETDDLKQEQRDQIMQAYRDRQAGAKNAGLPFIASKIVDWKQTAWSPADMQWAEGLRLTADQIAHVYEWPPQLIGNNQSSTYNNIKEMLRYAYTGKIIPEMDALRDGLNRFLKASESGFFLDYNTEDIEALQEDRAIVWDRVLRAWQGGLLSLNESRREVGFEDVEGGDERQKPIGLFSFGTEQDEFDKSLRFLEGKGLNDYRRVA